MSDPAWTVFIDLGVASAFLLLGQLLRARVGLVQRLFLPASVVAGCACLVLGPNGLDRLPFSSRIEQYPALLIALVFASLPFSSGEIAWGRRLARVGRLWSYSAAIFFLQWGGGVLLSLVVLRGLQPNLEIGFGTVLASGFVGGHGTAVAVGTSFAAMGWPDATDLALTFATVGLLTSIVGGMLWIGWGVATGNTRHLSRFSELPIELRTGFVPPGRRVRLGEETTSPISIDPLVFQTALVLSTALAGFYLSRWSELAMSGVGVPAFCAAFLSALAVKAGLRAFGAIDHVEPRTMGRIGGACTDLLVVFGIASIRISLVLDYVLPLLGLYLFGVIISILLFRLVAPRAFGAGWFETALFTWGWTTGVTAMGIALLRVVDSKNQGNILDDFAVAYLALAPLEIGLIVASPVLLARGHHWPYALATVATGLLLVWLSSRGDPRVSTSTDGSC